MLNRELWEISGHWFNYRENMYTSSIDDVDFAIKPMNCPGGVLAFKYQQHSYRDLPARVAELEKYIDMNSQEPYMDCSEYELLRRMILISL